ncbi:von Willebrand factor A domain-containing protein 5A-like isoform X2 [Pantherophis guttatus]|uniref:von Willebrand factor A domain-containing protein 5A-like isoform X2 n=1 Tax=Pantherophis guttatus TaxID=94885 RepID=A0A6P9C3T8_PANGU|nr:von Willebrand factor A domain-containing protein 5A-like isoform X2 [Pantherophis guttatus]
MAQREQIQKDGGSETTKRSSRLLHWFPSLATLGPSKLDSLNMWRSATDRYGFLTSSNLPVPLKSISVDVIIRGFVADVVSELQYQNEEKNPVEATFVFPLDGEAAVYAFEGLICGTRIEAQIREKKQAEQEYDDALSEGRQTFLLEREKNTSDIFTCNLGNLPPGGEATLKLRYVQTLAVEPDDAVRFVLPAVLNPRYVPAGSEEATVNIVHVLKEDLSYTLSLSARLESPYGINRVESKCSLDPLQYMTEDRTTAQVSLAEGHQFDRDVELLVYYEDIHKTIAILEAGKSGAAPGSLMGDPALLLTLYPNISVVTPDHSAVGELIFLLDCSGSMGTSMDNNDGSPSCIQSAKETLIFLLKSLPLGCYFNVYGFGSTYESFYPQSVEYTQETMSTSIQCVKELDCNLGGTEILEPLKAIYSQPCLEGNPRQIFVFTDGEVFNTNEVIAEVRRNSGSHRCFCFGIGEGASTALVKGIARAAGGSAEFITGKDRMQARALQSLKKALQPAVTGISLSWELPSGLEAKLVGSGPQFIFQGQRCLIYAQIRGQIQTSGSMEGTAVVRYNFQNETPTETTKFSFQLEKTDRLPVHRLAAQVLLQELEEEKMEEKRVLALETSLSSGVVCSQTAYVGVNMELGKPVQGPLLHRDVPLPGMFAVFGASPGLFYNALPSPCTSQGFGQFQMEEESLSLIQQDNSDDSEGDIGALGRNCSCNNDEEQLFEKECDPLEVIKIMSTNPIPQLQMYKLACEFQEEESPLLKLVSLQNADGSWPHGPALAAILDLNEAEISGKAPAHVTPDIWVTVLAILWLHLNAAEQKDEWELLEGKAVHWLKVNAEAQLAECVKAGNAVLGSSVSPQIWGL